MFWIESQRKWIRHPDCRCTGPYGGPKDLCICRGLRPLNAQGQPMDYPVLVDAMRSGTAQEVSEPEAVMVRKGAA